ncbi:hypothetical protein F1559_004689 [Cyanidiococcus yangmingshanensis]|uniref:DUF2428 domain-containing protein n=1 Tax=Cyanidiococcus yangmingshanensis TaxID=2690220 RepID=A0A7J7IJY8_9RHOD|nr:hypothetical protein F1559_004689 [Cyanidiococcus yangmingshanensis]
MRLIESRAQKWNSCTVGALLPRDQAGPILEFLWTALHHPCTCLDLRAADQSVYVGDLPALRMESDAPRTTVDSPTMKATLTMPREIRTALDHMTRARTPAELNACIRQLMGKMIEVTGTKMNHNAMVSRQAQLHIMEAVLLLTDLLLFGTVQVSSSVQCTWIKWLDRWVDVWVQRWSTDAASVPLTDALADWRDPRLESCAANGARSFVHRVSSPSSEACFVLATRGSVNMQGQNGASDSLANEFHADVDRLYRERPTTRLAADAHQRTDCDSNDLDPRSSIGDRDTDGERPEKDPTTLGNDECSVVGDGLSRGAPANDVERDGASRAQALTQAVSLAKNAAPFMAADYSFRDCSSAQNPVMTRTEQIPIHGIQHSISERTEIETPALHAAPKPFLTSNRVEWLLETILGRCAMSVSADPDRASTKRAVRFGCADSLRPDQLRGLYALTTSVTFRSRLAETSFWNRTVPSVVNETLRSYVTILAIRCGLHKGHTQPAAIQEPLGSHPPEAVDDIVRCACRLIADLDASVCEDALLSLLAEDAVPRSVVWNAAKSLALHDHQQGLCSERRLQMNRLAAFSQLAYIRSRFECDLTERSSTDPAPFSVVLDGPSPVSDKVVGRSTQFDHVLPLLESIYRENPWDLSLRSVAAETMIILLEHAPLDCVPNTLLVSMLLETTNLSDRFFRLYFRRMRPELEKKSAFVEAIRHVCTETPTLAPSHFRLLRMLIREDGIGFLEDIADQIIPRTLRSMMMTTSLQLVKSATGFLDAWYTTEQRSKTRGRVSPTQSLPLRVGRFLRHYLAQAPSQHYEDASRVAVSVLPMLLKRGARIVTLVDSILTNCDDATPPALSDPEAQTAYKCSMLLVLATLVRARAISTIELVPCIPSTTDHRGDAHDDACSLNVAVDSASVSLNLMRWALARAEEALTLDALYVLTQPQAMTTAPISSAHMDLLLDSIPALLVGRISQKASQMICQFFIKYIGPACFAISQQSGYWATAACAASQSQYKAEDHEATGNQAFLESCSPERRTVHQQAGPDKSPQGYDRSEHDSRGKSGDILCLMRNKRVEYAQSLGNFLGCWIRLLAREVGPGVSPERRFGAIALLDAVGPEVWSFMQQWYAENQSLLPEVCAVVLGCFLDPYDRVRRRAYLLLLRLADWMNVQPVVPTMISLGSVLVHSWTRRRADAGALLLRAAVTLTDVQTRVSHASVAHPMDVCDQRIPPARSVRSALLLELMLQVDQHSLVHGHLLTLRYLITDCIDPSTGRWRETAKLGLETIARLCLGCMRIINRCTETLRAAGGEDPTNLACFEELVANGFLDRSTTYAKSLVGDDAEPVTDDTEAEFGRRSTLHTVFLTVKEVCHIASALVGIICSECAPNDRIEWDSSSMLNACGAALADTKTAFDLVRLLCDLLVGVLLSYRHNGICGHASVCWNDVCKRLVNESNALLQQLPNHYLDDVLERIREHSLYVLRRSAGMPLLILGVLSATVAAPLELIANTLLPMCQSWQSGETIPSVHAMHVLRALLQDANLTQRTESLVVASFIEALESFRSSAPWMVRNAALLLLSACIQRMLGPQTIPPMPRTHERNLVCLETDNLRRDAPPPEMMVAAGSTRANTPFDLEPFWKDPLFVPSSSLTIDTFLSRYAAVLPSVNRTLAEAAENDSEPNAAVFPLLILLSSLVPSASLERVAENAFRNTDRNDIFGDAENLRAVNWSGRRALLGTLLDSLERLSCSSDYSVRRKAALAWARIQQTCSRSRSLAEIWPEVIPSANALQGALLRLRYLHACGALSRDIREEFHRRFQPLAFAKAYGFMSTMEALRLYLELGLGGGPLWLPFCQWVLTHTSQWSVGAIIVAALALECLCILPADVSSSTTICAGHAGVSSLNANAEFLSAEEDPEPLTDECARLLSYLHSLVVSTEVPELAATAIRLAQKLSPDVIPTDWSSVLLDSLQQRGTLYVQANALRWILGSDRKDPKFFDAVWSLFRTRARGSTVLGDLALEALGCLVHDLASVQCWIDGLESLFSEDAGVDGGVAVERRLACARSIQRAAGNDICRISMNPIDAWRDTHIQRRLGRLCWRLLDDDEEMVRNEARIAVACCTGLSRYGSLRSGFLEWHLAGQLAFLFDEPEEEVSYCEHLAESESAPGPLNDREHHGRSACQSDSVEGWIQTLEAPRPDDRWEQTHLQDERWRLLFGSEEPNVAHSEPFVTEQLNLYMAYLRKYRNPRDGLGSSLQESATEERLSSHGQASLVRDAATRPQGSGHQPVSSCLNGARYQRLEPQLDRANLDDTGHRPETVTVRGIGQVSQADAFCCAIKAHLLRALSNSHDKEPDHQSLLENATKSAAVKRPWTGGRMQCAAHSLLEQLVLGQFRAMLAPRAFCKRYAMVARRVLALSGAAEDGTSQMSCMDQAPALRSLCQQLRPDVPGKLAAAGPHSVLQIPCAFGNGAFDVHESNAWHRMVWFLLPASSTAWIPDDTKAVWR